MILRRFMKHVTAQNWFAVGLDVIVVIRWYLSRSSGAGVE